MNSNEQRGGKEKESRKVLFEHEGKSLVRLDSIVQIGDREYKGYRHQIWNNREEIEELAGYTDEEALEIFKQKFM